ncbi:MAG: CDP-glycerol glycerophosphotransferase family protein, partial [Acidobacteriota bacterium]|nr:CDP-glycerol glycerophosphotransferase family protein [Acidobacteriota bacterium]
LGIRPFVRLARRSAAARRALSAAETRVFTPDVHADLFARYQPSLVVTSGLGYWTDDAYLLREAHAHGARTAAVILSWDNPCSKGIGGAPVDYAVAWTDAMRDELVAYHDFDPARIFVGGIAHFDTHARRDPAPPPTETLRALGADPARQTILFGTASPTVYDALNRDTIAALGEALAAGRLGDAQLVVRVHPLYLGRGTTPADGARIEALRALAGRFPHVVLDVPETSARQLGFDMPGRDQAHLRSLLIGSDVMVTVFSTVMLEAAVLDVPIVNVAFRTWNEKLQDLNDSQERLPYMRRAFGTGGVRLAYSPAALVEEVAASLRDRGRDAEGRARLRAEECGPNPGRAGEAIAAYLYERAATA